MLLVIHVIYYICIYIHIPMSGSSFDVGGAFSNPYVLNASRSVPHSIPVSGGLFLISAFLPCKDVHQCPFCHGCHVLRYTLSR